MRWFRSVSLRLQIILLVVSFTLAVGLGNVFRAHLALEDLAREQFERRSVATALALAAQANELILTNDLFGLYDLLNSMLVNTPDIRYILVVEPDGQVRAHTFGPGLPRGLVEANRVSPGESWHIRQLVTEEGGVVDVAMPLPDRPDWVLRLGMSDQALEAAVDRHTMHLLGLAAASLVPVLVVTFILGRALTRPLLKLVEVTRAISRGDLSRQAPVVGRDEVAQLGQSFNAMTAALARSRAALEESNLALKERNEELAAVYAVATATAHVDTVDSLVNAALSKSLEVMGLESGWVYFDDPATPDGPVLQAVQGISPNLAGQLAGFLPPGCIPGKPEELHEAVLAHGGAPCSCMPRPSGRPEGCHAVVPLRSRTRLWGTMHLTCPAPACFTPAHLKLLTAIGRQVGVAIENVHLAQEQRRESFRRLLLDRVIVAQEEERKRIARELHDELAQNLTVLIRDLETVDRPVTAGRLEEPPPGHDTRGLARQILEQTRRLIFDLRPTALDDLGLLPAIRRFARQHLEAARIALNMEVLGRKRRLPAQVETNLFRIAQEAVTNVVRHAGATQVQIGLNFAPSAITLTVADNGRGFDASIMWEPGNGAQSIGLLGMRERAELLGGHLEIDTSPGAGTTVRVEIPLEA